MSLCRDMMPPWELKAEITRLEARVAELKRLETSGICEVAASNPSVMDYVRHWEGRTEKAESRVAELEKALREMKGMAEYWINLGIPERGCSKERYDTWLALGHHSKAMSLARAALNPSQEPAA